MMGYRLLEIAGRADGDVLEQQGLGLDLDAVDLVDQQHDRVFVIEQNRDAQMKSLLMLEANDIADRLVSILHYNGMPIPSECVSGAS